MANPNLEDKIIFQELLESWGLSEPIIMGQYTAVNDKPFGFFNDIKDKIGNKLYYPNQFATNVSAYIHRNDLESGTYYQFSICLASEKERNKKKINF